MRFTEKDRLKFAVIDVATGLAGEATGSCSGSQIDEIREGVAWLEWRISDGWHPSKLDYAAEYDESVRALARKALAIFKDKLGRHL